MSLVTTRQEYKAKAVQVSCKTENNRKCVQSWCPYLKRHTCRCVRKGILKRATPWAYSESLSCHEIFAELGLTTLETRRLRGDLIEVFQIFKDLYLSTTEILSTSKYQFA